MSYYKYHMFFCTNRREDGRACCEDHGAQTMRDYAKAKIKQLGMAGKDQVRVNNAGCLDRCDEGPVLVIYPEGVWYTYVDQDDIDEIIEKHLVQGQVVDRLKL